MAFKFYALWFSAICILFFALQLIIPNLTENLLLNEQVWSQPWRFATSIFLHGDIAHLLYNLFALALFGSVLEKLIGDKKFIIVFFITGILANIVSVNFYPSSLGASGAIFGVIGALIIVKPLMTIWAFGLPMPIFIAGILWVTGDVIGIFVPSNVGNIAHLSGVFFGLIFGLLYRDWSRKSKTNNPGLNEEMMRDWEDRHLRP